MCRARFSGLIVAFFIHVFILASVNLDFVSELYQSTVSRQAFAPTNSLESCREETGNRNCPPRYI